MCVEYYFNRTDLIKKNKEWFNAIDKGKYVGIVTLDLQKAFDIINHSILILNLRNYGLSSSVMKWFDSYLKERQFITAIKSGNLMSKNTPVVSHKDLIRDLYSLSLYRNDLMYQSAEVCMPMIQLFSTYLKMSITLLL